MRRRHAWEEEDRELGLQIAPLLDLLFVMLLFFMVTAGTHRAEKELPLDLAAPEKKEAEGGNLPPEKIARVEIGADGKILIEKEPISAEALLIRLRSLRGSDARVVIAPDARARQAWVVAVLEACATAGIDRVSLAECE